MAIAEWLKGLFSPRQDNLPGSDGPALPAMDAVSPAPQEPPADVPMGLHDFQLEAPSAASIPSMSFEPGTMLQNKLKAARQEQADALRRRQEQDVIEADRQFQQSQSELDQLQAQLSAPMRGPTQGETISRALSLFKGEPAQVSAMFERKRAAERAAQDKQIAAQMVGARDKMHLAATARDKAHGDLNDFNLRELQNQRMLDQTQLQQEGQSQRTQATQEGLNARADARNKRLQDIAYQKTPEGQFDSAIALAEKLAESINDPEAKAAFLQHAQNQAYENYSANTSKEKSKQEIAQRKAAASEQRVKLYGESIKNTKAYRDAVVKLGYKKANDAVAIAQARINASLQMNADRITAAEERQLTGQEFEAALFNAGYKVPSGAFSETPDQKLLMKEIEHQHTLIDALYASSMSDEDKQKAINSAKGILAGLEAKYKAAGQPKRAPLPTVKKNGEQSLRSLKRLVTDSGFFITSTTGGQHNEGSKHYEGKSVDVRTAGKSATEIKALIAQATSAGYTVRDERQRPAGQKVWSGPHIHIEF